LEVSVTIHESAQRGFARQADAYERGRPTYPPEAIAWLIDTLWLGPGCTAVDVGAGTGKLTRPLLGSGATVIAIEPVAAMGAVLERELPPVRALEGTAESLPLADGSVQAVVAGQAFHWFDAPAALAEFHRVLGKGGRLGLVWNLRDRRQPLQRALDEITEPLRGDTPSQARGAWRAELERTSLFKPAAKFELGFELEVDPDHAVDHLGSVSFIAALDDEGREQVLERVRRLAIDHPEPWAYVTEMYVWDAVAPER
jgi:SAM-dependent methyltransferase